MGGADMHIARSTVPEQPRYRWEIRQGGETIASGDAPCKAAFRYAMHAASIYLQDGPLSLTIKPIRAAKAAGRAAPENRP